MVEVIWTEQAIEDINNIAEFTSKKSFKYAKIQVEKKIQTTSILENNPLIGRQVPETLDKSVIELIIGTYRIIYKVKTRKILILTVHHSSRSMDNTKPNKLSYCILVASSFICLTLL
jgi:toxin ParE1/3/4